MRIGFIGLGKMGMNMIERLLNSGFEIISYARTSESVRKSEGKGATGAGSLEELVNRLTGPRIIWLMVPAGSATEETLMKLALILKEGDIVIDGGNSFYRDSMRRAEELRKRGISFLDAGTSGGIWGLQRGYCLMVGGDRDVFEAAQPVFRALAPEDGFAHVGPSGSGHYVKMIHNG
ncbi:MAG: NAD(P)-binding domain-containing protein, partial [Nitrospirae bacterium]|nr:NAD(P)-binding domain-containing protein [Nitrospirota bacterium]